VSFNAAPGSPISIAVVRKESKTLISFSRFVVSFDIQPPNSVHFTDAGRTNKKAAKIGGTHFWAVPSPYLDIRRPASIRQSLYLIENVDVEILRFGGQRPKKRQNKSASVFGPDMARSSALKS
jgi:hypothetical protein